MLAAWERRAVSLCHVKKHSSLRHWLAYQKLLVHILEDAVRNSPAVASRLQQHLQGFFLEEHYDSTEGKQRAWKHYCLQMFGQKVPALEKMPWPPSEVQWMS